MNGHLNTVTAFCVGELLMVVFIVRHFTWGGVGEQRLFCLPPRTVQGKHCQQMNASVPMACYPL